MQHRLNMQDYAQQEAPIRIALFDGRMEIEKSAFCRSASMTIEDNYARCLQVAESRDRAGLPTNYT